MSIWHLIGIPSGTIGYSSCNLSFHRPTSSSRSLKWSVELRNAPTSAIPWIAFHKTSGRSESAMSSGEGNGIRDSSSNAKSVVCGRVPSTASCKLQTPCHCLNWCAMPWQIYGKQAAYLGTLFPPCGRVFIRESQGEVAEMSDYLSSFRGQIRFRASWDSWWWSTSKNSRKTSSR